MMKRSNALGPLQNSQFGQGRQIGGPSFGAFPGMGAKIAVPPPNQLGPPTGGPGLTMPMPGLPPAPGSPPPGLMTRPETPPPGTPGASGMAGGYNVVPGGPGPVSPGPQMDMNIPGAASAMAGQGAPAMPGAQQPMDPLAARKLAMTLAGR